MNPQPACALAEPAAAASRQVHLFLQQFKRGGGIERYTVDLCGSLQRLGWSVQVHARTIDEALVHACGVSAHCHRVWRFPRQLRGYHFFRAIRRAAASLNGWQIALTSVPVRDLIVCGGTHRGYMARAGRWVGPFDRLQMRLEDASYHHARRVVSHSRLCAGELDRLYQVPTERITQLYPPVSAVFRPAASAEERAARRRELGFPDDRVVLLFPSTGHRRKGLHAIGAALAALPDPPILAVAGNPPRAGWGQGGQAAPWLHYLGYRNDMVPAYQAADFAILGSSYEPFGLVGPEAVLCGTRLVFEENIGSLEAVHPGAVLTFSVHDQASIQRAVTEAVALARAGRHRLERPEDWLRYDPDLANHTRALLRAAGVQDI